MSAPPRPEANRWILGRLAVGVPRVRLVCLPQAGAGPGAFAGWRQHVPEGYELAPVQYPARGTRESEPMPETFGALADALFEGLVPETTTPYVLYGHSFGGSLAYEMTRRIEAAGLPAPLATVVSGCRAPHVAPPGRMSGRPDAELVGWLVDNGGLPPELLRYTEFLQQAVRAIRTDLVLAEEYLLPAPVPVRCPLHVFGGVHDRVAPADGLNDWRLCAAGDFSATVLPGTHAFPHTGPAALLAAMLDLLPSGADPAEPADPAG